MARLLMHGCPAQLPPSPLPAMLQPHCVLLWCGTFSCSAQLKAPKPQRIPALPQTLACSGLCLMWDLLLAGLSSCLISRLLWGFQSFGS